MYNRTQNDNGTYNTRCLHCFMTIASAIESDKEIDILEVLHVCPERALAEMAAHGRPQLLSAGRVPENTAGHRPL